MTIMTRPASARKAPPAGTRKRPKDVLRKPAAKAAPSGLKPRRPESLWLFRNNNTKLGPGIYSWSIPAITTCPGATAACLSACYATTGTFKFSGVKAHFQRNFELSKTDAFADEAIAEIRQRKIKVLRVHVAGDFYDVSYLTKWSKIALACPETRFFIFTRSWRIAGFLPALKRLARLPNVFLWLSEDSTSGRAPKIDGARIAYMVLTPADEAHLIAGHHDLVFRDVVDRPAKWISNCKVCPYEDGVSRKVGKIGCGKCGICYSPPKPSSQKFNNVIEPRRRYRPVPGPIVIP